MTDDRNFADDADDRIDAEIPSIPLPDSDDDESLREYGRQLAMDSLLRQHYQTSAAMPVAALIESESPQSLPSISHRSAWRHRYRWVAAAAVAVTITTFLMFPSWRGPRHVTHSIARQLHGWTIDPVGEAQYTVTGTNVVQLERGEIMIVRTGDEQATPLTVQTPNSQITSRQAKCLIGVHHASQDSFIPGAPNMWKQLTRVLVLSGLVTLATDRGAVEGQAAELLAAADKQPPVAVTVAVQSNTQFAVDLYRQLAADAGDENLFLSPFSISSALTMLVEGARGETAEELGDILHLPAKFRRVGADAQRIPWETAKLYAGISQLNRTLDHDPSHNGNDPANQERKMVQKLRAELADHRQLIKDRGDKTPPEIEDLNREDRALRREASQLRTERKKHDENSAEYQKLQKQYEAIVKKRVKIRAQRRVVFARLEKEFQPLFDKEKSMVSQLNARLKKMGGYEIRVGNAIWGEKSFPFSKQYVDTIADAFQTGGLRTADFRGQADVERIRINDWVAEQTNQRIIDLLPDGSVDTNTRMVLTNAIYFLGDWKTPFKPRRTRPREFTFLDGTKNDVMMMSAGSLRDCEYGAINGDGTPFVAPARYDANDPPQLYPDDDGLHLLRLPYRGDEVSMVIAVPMRHDGVLDLEKKLTAETLQQWLAALRKQKTHVRLPKFKLESSIDLKTALQQMGLKRVFDESSADLSGMVDRVNSENPLYVTSVLHKSFIEVHEEGTEAAAATGIAVGSKAAEVKMVNFTPMFNADRPFFYLIQDHRTNTILFMGRLMTPKT